MRPEQTKNKFGGEGGICILAEPGSKLKFRCRWSVTRHEHFLFVGLVLENAASTSIPTPCNALANLFRSCISFSHHCTKFGSSSHSATTTLSGSSPSLLSADSRAYDAKIGSQEVGSAAAFKFLIDALNDASGSTNHTGYIARSDIVPFRLVDCEPLEGAVSFANPLQYFPEFAFEKRNASLSELLSVAAGGFFVRKEFSGGEPHAVFDTLQGELLNRFSFAWSLAEVAPLRQRTLAVVEGGGSPPDYNGLAAMIYPAARALGLHLVVLDHAGHWLEDGEHNDLRESFVPVELTPDSDVLADNIFAALQDQAHRIGGIVSFFDEYQVGVAKAAERLSLPTVSPEAFVIATNKFDTSVAAGRRAYRGHSVEDAVAMSQSEDLNYPLIVKPCSGWMSEGVFKVAQREELVNAVSQIDFKRHGTEYVVEEYCEGPEVDFNVVMYDGEILFHEISDDYPKAAEGNGSRTVNSFIEMDSVEPSKLPESEQLILQRNFHDILLRSGLNFGAFHIEGRVKNSSMEFRKDASGILDLHPREVNEPSPEPSGFVLDINPRPPGQAASVQPRTTYGVDYHTLSMLIALRDGPRVSALAHPFLQRNQYWSDMVYIPTDFPPDRVGIFDSDDICEDLKRRRPDLARHISTCATFVKRGEKVSHPSTGVLTWVAYYTVFSRVSRRHVLEIAREVRQETRYSVL
ncbi:ATP-grasp domain-containing protein [Xylaria cf. heliscus]|nr:ATP-grasp domain-containing protein [Xylaria cf. heliscus]